MTKSDERIPKQSTAIRDPVDLNKNPSRRGADVSSSVKWPAELLTQDERRREVRMWLIYLAVFQFGSQLFARTIPIANQYPISFAVAFGLHYVVIRRIPTLMRAYWLLAPLCLLPPWHIELTFVRSILCWAMSFYAAYQFRSHLVTFVSAAPLPSADARRYQDDGTLPPRATMEPVISGSLNGYRLGLESWFSYLGAELRLPAVYESPSGPWFSRTFVTILGVFGMIFVLPTEKVLIFFASLFCLVHPVLVLLAIPIALLAPVWGMGLLAFVFSIDRLCSAWSLKRYATFENTFPGLMKDLTS